MLALTRTVGSTRNNSCDGWKDCDGGRLGTPNIRQDLERETAKGPELQAPLPSVLRSSSHAGRRRSGRRAFVKGRVGRERTATGRRTFSTRAEARNRNATGFSSFRRACLATCPDGKVTSARCPPRSARRPRARHGTGMAFNDLLHASVGTRAHMHCGMSLAWMRWHEGCGFGSRCYRIMSR